MNQNAGDRDPKIEPLVNEEDIYRELDRIIKRAGDENKALKKMLKKISRKSSTEQHSKGKRSTK
ncbi:MAG: hypothetical protein P8100_10350 [bacterium]|jgi:hypothetical protein